MMNVNTTIITNDITTSAVLDEKYISSLSKGQKMFLSLIPIIPSLLSIFGSCMIIILIILRRAKKKLITPYHRIMLGMSIGDIITSITFPLQPFLIPYDDGTTTGQQRPWAIGNDTTCTMLGLFTQLTSIGPFYNVMLSYYFLLTIRFGIKDYTLFKYGIEFMMHIIPIGFAIITSIVGVIMGYYNEIEIIAGCWVTNYPKGCGCDINDNEYGECCQSKTIAWYFAGIPLLFGYISILLNNTIVFCYVRNTIHRSRKHNNNNIIIIRNTKNNNTTTIITTSEEDQVNKDNNNNSNNKATNDTTTTTKDNNDSQIRRIQSVATQATLYVICFIITFLLCHILSIMVGENIIHAQDEHKYYIYIVVATILYPMQGFFNMFIYIRPTYMRCRKMFPNQTKLWCLKRSFFGTNILPKSTTETNNNNNNNNKKSKNSDCQNNNRQQATNLEQHAKITTGIDT